MSTGTPFKLDKDRTLLYRFGDLKDARRALGGKSTSEIALMVLQADVEAISVLLWVGLRHEDAKLGRDMNRVDDAIQEYLAAGGELYELTTPILDALKSARLLPKTFAERSAEAKDPPAGP